VSENPLTTQLFYSHSTGTPYRDVLFDCVASMQTVDGLDRNGKVVVDELKEGDDFACLGGASSSRYP
jgi:hypothetical protein